ncbi:MAG: FeoA family protein [candidate division WOR-3 bacterium]
MTLAQVPKGKVKIVGFLGERHFQRKMNALGILIGDSVEIIVNNFHGPVIIGKGTMRIAIGWGMANKIIVEKVEE